jgi:hypothetical protein
MTDDRNVGSVTRVTTIAGVRLDAGIIHSVVPQLGHTISDRISISRPTEPRLWTGMHLAKVERRRRCRCRSA